MASDEAANAKCVEFGSVVCVARAWAVPSVGLEPFLVVVVGGSIDLTGTNLTLVPDVLSEAIIKTPPALDKNGRPYPATWSWEQETEARGLFGGSKKYGTYLRNGSGVRVYIINSAVNCTVVGGWCATADLGWGSGSAGDKRRLGKNMGGNGTKCALAARAAASSVSIVSVPTLPSSLARLLVSLSVVGGLHANAVAAGEQSRAVAVLSVVAPIVDMTVAPLMVMVERFLVRLRAAGVVSVAGAGNNARNACYTSPGGVSHTALVVAAATYRHGKLARAADSNHGECCDLFGPSDSTDTAAGFVAGVAAGICGDPNEPGPAWLVSDTILTNGTVTTRITNRLGTPNVLVHAPLKFHNPAIIEPDSEWIPIGLGLCLILAAIFI